MLVAFGIILGVAVIIAIGVVNESTRAAVIRAYEAVVGKASLSIESQSQAKGKELLDQDMLTQIQKMPEVVVAAPLLTAVTLPTSKVKSYEQRYGLGGLAPGAALQLYGIEPGRDVHIRAYTLMAGRFLEPNETRHSIVLVDEYAAEIGIEVGEKLEIILFAGETSLRVVGLIREQGPGTINAGSVGFVPLSVLKTLYERGSQLDRIDLSLQPDILADPDKLETFRLSLQAHLGQGVKVVYPAAGGESVIQSLAGYQAGLGYFSVIALFGGIFIILNALMTLILERTREIGMLRALGMTRDQVTLVILTETLLIGGGSSWLGVQVGPFLAQGLVTLMARVVAFEVETLVVPDSALTTGLIAGLGMTLFAALIPTYQATRISPLEAIRIRGTIDESRFIKLANVLGPTLVVFALICILYVLSFEGGSIFIFVLLLGGTLCVPLASQLLEPLLNPLVQAWFGSVGQIGAKNIERNRLRTAFTAGALMLGITMFVGIRGLADSFRVKTQLWAERMFGGDLQLSIPLTSMRLGFGQQLENLDSVLIATPRYYLATDYIPINLRLDGAETQSATETLLFIAVDPLTFPQVAAFNFEEGQADEQTLLERFAQGQGIIATTTLANRYNLEIGDQLTLKTRRGLQKFDIIGLIVDFVGGGTVIYGSWQDAERYFGVRQAHQFDLKVAPNYTIEQATSLIEKRFGQKRDLQVADTRVARREALEFSDRTLALFDVTAGVALVVGLLGIANTTIINIWERRREIGGLRAIGMSKGQILQMILAESVITSVVGGVMGAAFGLVLTKTMRDAIQAGSGFNLDFIIPYSMMGLALLLSLGMAQIAAIYPALRAANLNMIEAIKYE